MRLHQSLYRARKHIKIHRQGPRSAHDNLSSRLWKTAIGRVLLAPYHGAENTGDGGSGKLLRPPIFLIVWGGTNCNSTQGAPLPDLCASTKETNRGKH